MCDVESIFPVHKTSNAIVLNFPALKNIKIFSCNDDISVTETYLKTAKNDELKNDTVGFEQFLNIKIYRGSTPEGCQLKI